MRFSLDCTGRDISRLLHGPPLVRRLNSKPGPLAGVTAERLGVDSLGPIGIRRRVADIFLNMGKQPRLLELGWSVWLVRGSCFWFVEDLRCGQWELVL